MTRPVGRARRWQLPTLLTGGLVWIAVSVAGELVGGVLSGARWLAGAALALGALAWVVQQLMRARAVRTAPEPAGSDLPVPLPAPPPELVGRTRELAAALELARRERLLLVHGPRGIGTSALAAAVARELTAGAPATGAYADLRAGGANRNEPAGRARLRVLAALGIAPAGAPTGEETYEHVAGRLKAEGTVLLLDNVRDVGQVDWLAPVPAGYVLLAGDVPPWPGIPAVRVGALGPDDGLALLRADPAVAPRLPARRDTRELAERYLRYPAVVLTLRSWLAENPAADVRALLSHLDVKARPGDVREPSALLRKVFELTTAGVSAPARQLLSLLPHMPLTWLTEPAAAALLDRPAAEAGDVLGELSRSGLLAAGSPRRYRVPREARALGQGDPPADRDAALGRLVAYYAGEATGWREALAAPRTAPAAEAWFRQEDAALVALLGMAAEEPLPRSAAPWVALLGDALDVWFARDGRRVDRRDAAANASAAASRLGDPAGQVTALLRLAAVARAEGELAVAGAHLRLAASLGAGADPRLGTARAQLAYALGDRAGARAELERNLSRRARGDAVGRVVDQLDLGAVLVAQGALDRGDRLLREAGALAREAGDLPGLAYALELQGVVAARRDDPAAAAALWAEAQLRFEQLHDDDALGRCLVHRATLVAGTDPDAARELLAASLARRGPTGIGVAIAHARLAELEPDPAVRAGHRDAGVLALAPWRDVVDPPFEVTELRLRLESIT